MLQELEDHHTSQEFVTRLPAEAALGMGYATLNGQ
jgi:hypothetical protein